MHGDTGRLVQHDQGLVFINDGRLETLEQPLRQGRRLIALSQTQRRNANDVTRLQLVFRLDAALVHPHLAFTQNAVNQCLGHTL
ncbi:hypothetical protein D3C86_1616290 [compost metagenome]